MASITSPRTSPRSRPQATSATPADAIHFVQGRLPSQHTANSRVSLSSPPNAPIAHQLASARYIHQYRALIEHQRQVHDEERELWNLERSELLEEVSKLKATLRRARAANSNSTRPSDGSISGISSASGSSYTSTGDEFWRGAGGKSDAQPLRTFTESSRTSSTNIGERLPSIAEYKSPDKPRRSLLTESINGSCRPSVPQVQNQLDGITFKQTNFDQPSLVTSISTTEEAAQPPSPLHVSPPDALQTSSELCPPLDWNTKDAGHTPLARGSRFGTGGDLDVLSSPTTPTASEVERPPSEPHASAVRPPHERSDSYFTGVPSPPQEDPALSQPLNLGNSGSPKTQEFLETLDSRLQEAASASREDIQLENDSETVNSNRTAEQSEPEPKLRIKRSMNFGSEFGKLR